MATGSDDLWVREAVGAPDQRPALRRRVFSAVGPPEARSVPAGRRRPERGLRGGSRLPPAEAKRSGRPQLPGEVRMTHPRGLGPSPSLSRQTQLPRQGLRADDPRVRALTFAVPHCGVSK